MTVSGSRSGQFAPRRTTSDEREATKPTEDELRELAARGAAELEGAGADRPVALDRAEHFGGVNGPRGGATCNYIVASNMQDAVLVDLAAKVRPGVPVLFLDTGYHFVETIGTRDAIESVYDIRVLNLTAEHRLPSRTNCWARTCSPVTPASAAGLRKVVPLGKTLAATPPG